MSKQQAAVAVQAMNFLQHSLGLQQLHQQQLVASSSLADHPSSMVHHCHHRPAVMMISGHNSYHPSVASSLGAAWLPSDETI